MLAGRPAISVWIICLLSNRIISFRYFTQIILLAAFFFQDLGQNVSFLLFRVLTVPVGALVPWEAVASVSVREVMPGGWLAGCVLFFWLTSSLANLSPSLTGCSLA